MKKTLQNCMVAYVCVRFFPKITHAKVVAYRLMSVFFSMQKRKERRKFERRILMMQGFSGVNTISEIFVNILY